MSLKAYCIQIITVTLLQLLLLVFFPVCREFFMLWLMFYL